MTKWGIINLGLPRLSLIKPSHVMTEIVAYNSSNGSMWNSKT